jgi:hypothetical protein
MCFVYIVVLIITFVYTYLQLSTDGFSCVGPTPPVSDHPCHGVRLSGIV